MIKSGFGITPSITIVNLKVSLRNMIPSTLVFLFLAMLIFLESKIFPKLKRKLLIRRFSSVLPLIILVAATGELLRFAWKNTPFSPSQFLYPQTKTLEFLERQPQPFRIVGGIPTNLFMPYNLESAEGYDSIYSLQYARWLSGVESGKIDSPRRRYGLIQNYSSPLLNYANVEYVIDYKKGQGNEVNDDGNFELSLKSSRYQSVFTERRVSVFKNTQNFPRVWLSSNYKIISEPEKIIEELSSSVANQGKLLILESKPDIFIENKKLT